VTESDLQTLRIIVSITAIRTLLRECLADMAASSPARGYRYREIFAKLRVTPQTLALNGIDPGLQDLATNEYQEALDELLSYVEAGLRNESGCLKGRLGEGQSVTN